MTVNKVAICPICGKRTWLRIVDGGYLSEYPIRIHCMNCHTLIKGTYTMEGGGSAKGLRLYNANAVACDATQAKTDEGTDYFIVRNADYIAEISGELPCQKVRAYDKKTMPESIVLRTDNQTSLLGRIEQLRRFTVNLAEWERKKSIAFQLLEDGRFEFLRIALGDRMGGFKFPCDSREKSLHCLQETVLQESETLFINPDQYHTILSLLNTLSKVSQDDLHSFTDRLGGIQSLIEVYQTAIEVFSRFMSVYPYLLPAETFMRYKNFDQQLGISTCSFTDIKTFYQDSYESLLSIIFVPICLDNILLRGSYLSFNPSVFSKLEKREKDVKAVEQQGRVFDDYEWFLSFDHGMKLSRLQRQEPIQSIVALPGNRYLRNGIGHNNIRYDGLSQIITAYDQKDPTKINLTLSLMSMAIDCLKLARSAVVLSEIALFIIRRECMDSSNHCIIHPRFYHDTGTYDVCPCGSGKKFKWCCKPFVDGLTVSR